MITSIISSGGAGLLGNNKSLLEEILNTDTMIFPETAVIFLAKYTSSFFLLSHITHLIFPSVTHSSSPSHNKASSYLSLLFLHFLSFQFWQKSR
jgi:hypothetical protein